MIDVHHLQYIDKLKTITVKKIGLESSEIALSSRGRGDCFTCRLTLYLSNASIPIARTIAFPLFNTWAGNGQITRFWTLDHRALHDMPLFPRLRFSRFYRLVTDVHVCNQHAQGSWHAVDFGRFEPATFRPTCRTLHITTFWLWSWSRTMHHAGIALPL